MAAVAGDAALWDVTASGGDLAGLSGTVTLSLAQAHDITDRAGNALAGSLGGDRTYVLDNTAPGDPTAARHAPAESPTEADEVTWRIGFGEAVANVTADDFAIAGTTAALSVAEVAGDAAQWDVTLSGGDLADLNGTVTLSLAQAHDITDLAGNALAGSLGGDTAWQLDNTVREVVLDPAGTLELDEGGSVRWSVALSRRPAETVTVTVSAQGEHVALRRVGGDGSGATE